MNRLSLTLMLIAGAVALRAEEPGSIYLPGVETLDDTGKALYQRGNEDVKASYHALLDKNDPAEAERLLQEALAIIGTLTAQIGDSGPGGMKVGIYGNAKKNRNVVETSGGLDGIAEMEMKNLTTVTDYDFHLHHRSVLANFASQAKDVVALQKFIIKENYAAGNTKSYAGSQNPEKKHEKQEHKDDKKDDDTPDGPRRLQVSAGAQDQDSQQQKKKQGGQTPDRAAAQRLAAESAGHLQEGSVPEGSGRQGCERQADAGSGREAGQSRRRQAAGAASAAQRPEPAGAQCERDAESRPAEPQPRRLAQSRRRHPAELRAAGPEARPGGEHAQHHGGEAPPAGGPEGHRRRLPPRG